MRERVSTKHKQQGIRVVGKSSKLKRVRRRCHPFLTSAFRLLSTMSSYSDCRILMASSSAFGGMFADPLLHLRIVFSILALPQLHVGCLTRSRVVVIVPPHHCHFALIQSMSLHERTPTPTPSPSPFPLPSRGKDTRVYVVDGEDDTFMMIVSLRPAVGILTSPMLS